MPAESVRRNEHQRLNARPRQLHDPHPVGPKAFTFTDISGSKKNKKTARQAIFQASGTVSAPTSIHTTTKGVASVGEVSNKST
ncbi:MAG: hypothetical protein WBE33_07905, partial [Planococcus citreus]